MIVTSHFVRHARHAGRWLLGLGAAGLTVWALLPTARTQPPATPPPTLEDERPTLVLENFKAQVTRDGQPRQLIEAEWAQMDETDKLLTLRRVHSLFYNKGELQGETRCGYARTWLADRPTENIHRHDMHLMDKVSYTMKDGWILQVPQMRYASATETISSDQPYIKQLPMKNGFMIGRGDGFSMQLNVEAGTFVTWQEYGKPAVLEHSSTPVLQP